MKYTEDYLKFYDVYARHEGKAEGQKAWDKLDMLDREAAVRDVEERNRLNAWSKNKRLITLPATYLNQRRWEDDWKATVESARANPDGEVGDKPHEYSSNMSPPLELSFWESVFSKAWLMYMTLPMRPIRNCTKDDSDRIAKAALAIRDKMIKTDCPAFDEEIEAGTTTKGQASVEIVTAFVRRLDNKFKERRAHIVISHIERDNEDRYLMKTELDV